MFLRNMATRRKTRKRRTGTLASRTVRRKRPAPVKLPKIEVSKEQSKELWGTIFGVMGVLSLFAMMDSLGIFGDVFAQYLFSAFGVGGYALPIFLFAMSLSLFFSQKITMDFTRTVGIFLLLVGGLGIVHIVRLSPEIAASEYQLGGGFFGAAGSIIPRYYLGDIGASILLAGIALMGSILTFPISISGVIKGIFSIFTLFVPEKSSGSTPFEKRRKEKEKQIEKQEKEEENMLELARKEAEKRRQEFRKQEKKEGGKNDKDKPLVMTAGEWEFPSLNLLSDEKMTIVSDEMELDKKERMIQEKLAEFGIGSDRGPANAGPTVTQFTLKPHEGVKLAKITNLKNDLALALSTPSLRLEAPIPGKDLIGIEIPNEKRATVHLKEILESREFEDIKSPLRLAMGRDVAGNAVVADLAEMPHLLIAGATGAGKSVGMNTFLMSLLFQNSPADLKLIMVDPKRVELMPYNNIPHLLTPVITEAEKALAALRWCVAEMMRRYGELAQKGYRNVAEYNAKEEEKMPKIVIVIDELADLMMRQLKKDTEAAICRLAQMARAVGMHLIVATQRPSVDVITGLIKANIPTRISFAVTSAVDSRTILDSIGAEDLLGKGDMLFSNAALSKPRRIQGIFVSSEEINRVTNKLKIAGQPEYDDSVTAGSEPDESGLPDFSGGGSAGGNINEQAVEVIRSTGKASASLLQRRLSVGYARAARILDELEEQGLIGPARGAKPREIYL
jgi:S-DNA-T family DNA segregation ATPase FtsK/SpoIIIE